MEQFLVLLSTELKKKRNFETVNAHLGLFLQVKTIFVQVIGKADAVEFIDLESDYINRISHISCF